MLQETLAGENAPDHRLGIVARHDALTSLHRQVHPGETGVPSEAFHGPLDAPPQSLKPGRGVGLISCRTRGDLSTVYGPDVNCGPDRILQ